VVDQLLALARQDDAAATSPVARVDLAAVARDAIAAHADLAAAKDVDLGAGPLEPLSVDGEPDALATLAAHLVGTAVRYTPAGGHVVVLVERRDGAPTLCVRDDGPGIAPGMRDAMFERFARGARTEAPGSGLGLAIVKRIAVRHGATVALGDGPDGRGLEVTVRFPSPAGARP
jgi:two-component system OmpR family sensor kinase